MARTKPGEERRTDLLDAAEEFVLRNGVEKLTIDEVVAGAGVAKGTFYLHFTSKDHLVAALRDRYVARFVERQRATVAAVEGPKRLELWLQSGVAEYLSDTRLHDVLFGHAGHPRPDAPPRSNLAVEALRELLAEFGDEIPDPHATAVLLYHAMHGSADHVLHHPEDRDRLAVETARLCRRLAGPQP